MTQKLHIYRYTGGFVRENGVRVQAVRCASCGALWPETYSHCPTDGAKLNDATVLAQAAPSGSASSSVGATQVGPRQTYVDLVPGTQVVGDYEVVGKLGEGAMGAVYLATHSVLGKKVALKVIAPKLCADAGAIARFEQEAKTLAQLAHPGIVDVSSFGTLPDGRSYFVMEYLKGETLRERIKRSRLPLDQALDILDQIARALEAAHERGVTHRDLKPDNIFLVQIGHEPRPIVKLLDFGLAKLAATEDTRLEKTSSGAMLGTPLYMSPEQCKGKDVDHRTDVYAFGCIAYELICGQVPFDADNVAEIIAMHLHAQPPAPRSIWPEIPPALDAMLSNLLAKDAGTRPTLAEIRQALIRETPASERTATAQTVAPAAGGSRPLVVVALVLSACGGLLAYWLGGRATPAGSSDAAQIAPTVDAGVVAPGATPDAAVPQIAPTVDAGVVAPGATPDAAPAPVISIDAGVKPKKRPKKSTPKSVEPKRDPRDETIIVFPRGKP